MEEEDQTYHQQPQNHSKHDENWYKQQENMHSG